MTSDNRPPTLVAFLVGDSVGFIPKPWPRDRFKEALVDTLEAFGEPWVICECQQNDDGQDWLTVTKIAMEARSEYIEMKCTKPESSCTQENAQLKHSILEKAKAEDVNDTFCLLGITEENILTVLSNERGLPDQFNQLPDELKKKGFHGVHGTMLFLEEISKTMVTSLNLNENAGREFIMKVPTLVIVVEGDLETISHVAEAVKKDIPVLLVRGSGMAADLIGYCMEEEGAIETRAPLLFGICFSKENFESLVTNIKTIVKHKSKVTEFNILTDSVTSLKDKVTESIIRVWALAHVKGEDTAADFGYNPTNQTADVDDVPAAAQYNLPKQHNGVPRRTSKIVPISEKAVRPKSTESNRKITSNKDMKPSPISRYMLYQILQSPQTLVGLEKSLLAYALKEDLGDIVELLIDKGIKLEWADAERPSKETHLDEERKSPYEDGKSLYEEMHRERKRCQTNQARACIADIIELPEAQGLREKTGAWQIGCSVISYTIGTDAESKETNIMTPSDLLLWAVLNNNMKMAEIFWKRSHEPILTALIACTILRKMSRKAHHLKEREMEDKMLLHSRVFRQRAIDVTQRLYETNDQEAIFTLELENKTPVWGIRENALEFSQAHNIYDFVAHHVPQRSFDKIFYGGDFFHDNDLQNPKKPENSPTSQNPEPSKKMRTCWKFRFYDVLTFFKALVASPISKFAIHYIFFSLFLVCLSAFVMTNITSEKWPINEKTVYEYCSYVWLFADILEEYVPPAVYMLMEHFHSSQWKRRAWNHMNNFWNAMDFLSYVVLVTGIFVRFLYETTDFGISRRFFTIGLFLMYMRFLHVLLIRRKIGPTIIMLKEGLKELMRFFVIMAVFIISAGVFYHANLYPNHYDMFSTFGVRYWSVWKVIYLPYWSVYGEFKDEIEGNDSTDNCSYNQTVYMNDPDIVRCPEKDWMVSLMSGFFVLILNLLLVNLIIAMFSFRFEEINKNSDQFWRFHRSQVILEFRRRIPVPLNLLLRPIAILWFCITKSEREQQNEADVEARAKLDKKQQILARRWVLSESDAQMFFDK